MAQRRSQEKNREKRSYVHAGNTPVSFPGDADRDARAESALQLRILGYGYAAIARQCGYANASAAWKAIKRLRDKQRTDDQRTMADLQCARIEQAIVTVMESIRDWPSKEKLWAVDRLAPLLKRQAELLGLDVRQEPSASGPVIIEVPDSLANAIRGVPAQLPTVEGLVSHE